MDDTLLGHVALGLTDAVFGKMKDGRGQDRVRSTVLDPIDQVLQLAHAAGSDQRNGHGLGNCAVEHIVETALGAVAVHAGQQDLAGAIGRHLLRPLHGIDPGRLAPTMGEDLPMIFDPLGIDRDDDAL